MSSATEDTPLLNGGSTTTDPEAPPPTDSFGDNSSPTTSENSSTAQQLFQELEEPWPSTFQRSVSLLASPVIRKDEAKFFMHSPMPGSTPQMLAQRTTLRRGFYTPDPIAAVPPVSQRPTHDSERSETGVEGQDEFRQKLARIRSLDWVKKKIVAGGAGGGGVLATCDSNPIAAQQARKAQAAAAYRQKILQDQASGAKSPGFLREKASLRASTKKKAKQQQQQKFKGQQSQASSSSSSSSSTEGDDEDQDHRHHKSTFAQASFNLANILMGVGLLGLPFAFASAGWMGGNLCVVVFGFTCWRTAILIGRELNGDARPTSFHFADDDNSKDDSSSLLEKSPVVPSGSATANNNNVGGGGGARRMLTPIETFPDIARNAFGQVGCAVLSVILYFELFSCICIFFVSMGDHLHQLIPSIPTKMHMILVASASMGPTILLHTPALLSYLSAVGTVATVVVVLAVVLAAVLEGDQTEHLAKVSGIDPADHDATKPFHIMFDASGITLALGLVAYCFSGHAIVPSIYTSMRRPQEFETMVTTTFLIVMATCFAVSISGYYMFGSLVADQVTLSLERAFSSNASVAMKALLWLMVLTAFSKTTLTMFPLAIGMEELVAPYLTSERAVHLSSSVIKFVLTASALAVSILFPSFSFLCAVVGMICTMTVSVIFPAAAHLQMFGPKLSLWDKFLDWVFILVGLFMAVVGTYAALMGA